VDDFNTRSRLTRAAAKHIPGVPRALSALQAPGVGDVAKG
jgi:hypothetical protein